MNHLDGIKVLNVIETQVAIGGFNWLACIIAFFIVLVILTIFPRLLTFGKTAFEWKGVKAEFFIGFFLLLGSAGLGFMFGTIYQPTIPRTEYKICIVDENLSMKDFNNTYEIISKEGEIYTVVFKEETE